MYVTIQLDKCKWFNHRNVESLRNQGEFLSIRCTCFGVRQIEDGFSMTTVFKHVYIVCVLFSWYVNSRALHEYGRQMRYFRVSNERTHVRTQARAPINIDFQLIFLRIMIPSDRCLYSNPNTSKRIETQQRSTKTSSG